MFSTVLQVFTKIQFETPTQGDKKKFLYKIKTTSKIWWKSPVIPALHQHNEVTASVDYLVRSCLCNNSDEEEKDFK